MPDQFRGRGMGLWTSAFFLGQFLSPFLVTLVRGRVGGLLETFVACGVVCIALALANLLFGRSAEPAARGLSS